MNLQSVNELVELMLNTILEKSPAFKDTKPDHIVAMINNLGSTTNMELAIASKRLVTCLGITSFPFLHP